MFSPDIHLLFRCKEPPTWTLPVPTTREPLLLFPSPRAVCLYLPQFPEIVFYPLFCPWDALRSLLDPGGFARRGFLLAAVSLPHPPYFFLQTLASSSPWFLVGWIFARGRDTRTPPLPGSCASWSFLPLLFGHAVAVQANRFASSLSPYPPPLFFGHDPMPIGKKGWGIELEVGVMRAFNFRGRGCSACKTEGRTLLVV